MGSAIVRAQFLERLSVLTSHWELALLLTDASIGVTGRDALWTAVNSEAEALFDKPEGGVTDEQKAFVERETLAGTDVVCANAIAHAVDEKAWHLFPIGWRGWLGDPSSRVQLQNGAPFPVCDLERDAYPTLRPLTTRGTSKRAVGDGELRHLRRFNDGAFFPGIDVYFDFSFEGDLAAAIERMREIDLVQLNAEISELDLPAGAEIFPVAPANEARQEALVLEALSKLDPETPCMVVLPELSVTAGIVDAIEAFLASELPFANILVIAGSRHVTEDSDNRRNLSEGLMPNADARLTHRKLVRFENFEPGCRFVEGIDEAKELVVYSAGRARLAILICKDALDPRLSGLVAELGATVLAVPAMSPVTSDFPERIDAFVANTQGFAAASNGPLNWGAGEVLPRALVGQPHLGQTVLDWRTEDAPARALVRYRPDQGLAGYEPLSGV